MESKASVFSVESFMAALEEERAHNAAFFGDDDFVETTGELDFAATVRTLHTHHGDLNWCVTRVCCAVHLCICVPVDSLLVFWLRSSLHFRGLFEVRE